MIMHTSEGGRFGYVCKHLYRCLLRQHNGLTVYYLTNAAHLRINASDLASQLYSLSHCKVRLLVNKSVEIDQPFTLHFSRES